MKKNNVMKGGNGKEIPMYTEHQNTPFYTNEEKQAFSSRMAEKPQQSQQPQQNPMVNLQVYQPPKPREQPRQSLDPLAYMPTYSTNPFFPPQFGMPNPFVIAGQNIGGNFPAIVKNYNINTSVAGDHSKIDIIYEDTMPQKTIIMTPETLGGRLAQLNFVRSIMFSYGDGNSVSLTGNKTTADEISLMEHVKFLDLNPYNTYRLSSNPYRGLPHGFLIYRSCYPIRRQQNLAVCAKESMGINIRIYKMTEGAYSTYKDMTDNKYFNFDQNRDLAFYEFMREKIIKTKVCPNFTSMYGFYICEKSSIDFAGVDKLRERPTTVMTKGMFEPYESSKVDTVLGKQMDKSIRTLTGNKFGIVLKPETIDAVDVAEVPAIDSYIGRALIVMTESYNYNFTGWCTKVYQAEGNVKRMVNTGIHDFATWYSVLFQLLAALYVMDINGIVIENFSLENNVFVKDVPSTPTTKYWKYNINGIEYYIPNYGFLIMIDSNFKDIEPAIPKHFIDRDDVDVHKIEGSIFGDKNTYYNNQDKMKEKTKEMFKAVFNTNNFTTDFKSNHGVAPPDEILGLLGKMMAKIEASDFDSEQLFSYMTRFINNRVGTYLKEPEVLNKRDGTSDFKKGDILVEMSGSGEYKFIMFEKTNIDGSSSFYTRDTPTSEIVLKTGNTSTLSGYSKTEQIVQNFKPTETNLNEDELLETYIIYKK